LQWNNYVNIAGKNALLPQEGSQLILILVELSKVGWGWVGGIRKGEGGVNR